MEQLFLPVSSQFGGLTLGGKAVQCGRWKTNWEKPGEKDLGFSRTE